MLEVVGSQNVLVAQTWVFPALTTHHPGNHSVRTERWRYIRYANGDEELYDHYNDPNEWRNLARDPRFADVKRRLAEQVPKTNTPYAPPSAPEIH